MVLLLLQCIVEKEAKKKKKKKKENCRKKVSFLKSLQLEAIHFVHTLY